MTERNYHIFYQLCAGAPSKERKDLGLDTDVTKFHYLKQGGPSSTLIAGIDDAEEFRATQQALSTVGISVEKQWAVFRLLAALLHLGNIKVTPIRNESNIDDNDLALQYSTRFLGVNLADFKKWTIKRQLVTRAEKIVTTLNVAQAIVVRDSVAKFIYACMFEWLVAIVNESLAGENGDAAERAEMFIGVLDIYGFEHFQKVYMYPQSSFSVLIVFQNSFEQFSINYANEKLQQEVFRLKDYEITANSLSRSSTHTSSSWSKKSMSRKKSTGRSSTSPIISLALTLLKASLVFFRYWTKSPAFLPGLTHLSCRN